MYGTEYRVEWLNPPYMNAERPVLQSVPQLIGFNQTVKLNVRLPSTATPSSNIKVACMDLGYVTHAVHANSRLVYLVSSRDPNDASALSVTGPPNGNVYPPGPAWIYLVVDGIPSAGSGVIIGDGKGPEVDQAALEKYV